MKFPNPKPSPSPHPEHPVHPVKSSPTTAHQLASLIKSARDIMRKDKGLSTDLDRLPLLTWVMFLKFLDDMEQIEESRAAVRGEKYRPAIEPPYRWRDWAAKEDGITGPELLAFIAQEDATRPDGKKGPGLLAYLRGLTSGNGSARRRRVIATVFKDVVCRMLSGYLLRDVINKVNGIHFLAKEEVFTLGHLYETMLREMRDAAGQNGEFYTPRPVVKFMVEVVNPRLGEVVLDPACGTGGFLVEAYTHLEKQCKTVADRRVLQDKSLRGGEAKPLPYLLCQMNLLLHGLEAPDIDPENSLRFKLTEIGDRDRVDVILTNPPFGGEEEAGIKGNFPADRQTSETVLLFLQLIMRKLKRGPKPGRAAVVVPDGILAGDGICARIKKQLLEEFNLHTVVRLPGGVFAPYTGIPTNILFFDRSGPTGDVWFYEHPVPTDRKNYTKTAPIVFAEFDPCMQWWTNRVSNAHAWRVSATDIVQASCNLDVKNPAFQQEDFAIPLPLKASRLAGLFEELRSALLPFLGGEGWKQIEDTACRSWTTVELGTILREETHEEVLEPDQSYRLIGVRLAGEGPYLRETRTGAEIGATRLNRISAGQFIYSRLFAWRGAFGIVPQELDGCYASGEFPTYRVVSDLVLADFLRLYFIRPLVWQAVEKKCQGTTKASRNRFKEEFLLAMRITVPGVDVQRAVVGMVLQTKALASRIRELGGMTDRMTLDALASLYRGKL